MPIAAAAARSRIALRAIRATTMTPKNPELPQEPAPMRANDGSRTAAEVLIDQLVIHGARHVFCVPGESYIAALDAMVDRPLEVTVCRQEGGACIMAEAMGKLTGRPG